MTKEQKQLWWDIATIVAVTTVTIAGAYVAIVGDISKFFGV